MMYRIEDCKMAEDNNTTAKKKKRRTTSKAKPAAVTYVNVNRAKSGYRDKYKKDVDNAVREFSYKIGKESGADLTNEEWKRFFKTVLIPLDKESERKMIDLFIDNRDELNELLILHNTLASNNLAEVYFKKYVKESPTQWVDIDDFKQQALLGLAEGAKRFDPNKYDNKFITYATWWILNKIRKPASEPGAKSFHVSLNSPSHPFDSESTSTLEEVLTPDMLHPLVQQDMEDSSPSSLIDKKRIEENYDMFSYIKNLKSFEKMTGNEAKEMTKYLLSIVENNKKSYDNQQILLYMFRKVFNKCSPMFVGSVEGDKLTSYVDKAAKSKSELLTRLNIDKDEYEVKCNSLIRGGKFSGL